MSSEAIVGQVGLREKAARISWADEFLHRSLVDKSCLSYFRGVSPFPAKTYALDERSFKSTIALPAEKNVRKI
jgi:hypothetical protein